MFFPTDKPSGNRKKQAPAVSTGSDSEGVDSDRPLLRVSERDVTVSYKSGGKGKQKRKKVNVVGSDWCSQCVCVCTTPHNRRA